jgi:1-acyl-sn-glycerol-3-phosphate acyltransferase
MKFFFLLFYRIRVYGVEDLYPKGAIIAPNHTSFFDPPLISITYPEETYYLARATLFKNFFFRMFLRGLNAYPVKGSAQDFSSLKMIGQLLKQDKKVVIFPEGTRSDDGQITQIKTGISMLALRAECPIIPVYIHGAFEAWSRHRKWPKLGSSLTCVYGKPIFSHTYAHLEKKQAREEMTKEVQRSLEALHAWYLEMEKKSISK